MITDCRNDFVFLCRKRLFYLSLKNIKFTNSLKQNEESHKNKSKKVKVKIDNQLFVNQHTNEIETAINSTFSEEVLKKLAKDSGFIVRERELTGQKFLTSLMFTIHSQFHTSLIDHVDDFKQHCGIQISKQALHEKFNENAVKYLKEVLKLQLENQFKPVVNHELKALFTAVRIKDSTKFSLPTNYEGQYPSFGNFGKENGLMNIQYEYDLLSGACLSLELTNIKTNDQQNSKLTVEQINKGELSIRDLGFISATYLGKVIEIGANFLNRLPAQINTYDQQEKLLDWKKLDIKFNKYKLETLELEVKVYEKNKIPCRLIIERVSDEQYNKRLKTAIERAKSCKTGISDEHKLKCRYNTFITNIPKKDLALDHVRKTYYLRWQVEVVFKTWKSFFEIHQVKRVKKERMECQLLGKLIWILLNWRLFQICNEHLRLTKAKVGMSTIKFCKRCLKFSPMLRKVILQKYSLENWLNDDFLPLIDNAFCEAPKDKITHYEVFNNFIYS